MTEMHNIDLLSFSDDDDVNSSRTALEWKVLIVDDDEDVHQATTLALANTPILARSIQFLHAYSAAQALEILHEEQDIAVILLDVVMEREDAGLKLVRTIREDLGLHDLRIILRTGQPGYAPEIDAIRDYDINDYKTKSELSRSSLFTALASSIRSYQQIHALNTGRRGLDKIIQANSQLMMQQNIHDFSDGILQQINALLERDTSSLLCAHEPQGVNAKIRIIAASGRFTQAIGQTLDTLEESNIVESITQGLQERQNVFRADASMLFFSRKSSKELIAYIETEQAPNDITLQLLEVFCANISIHLDNVVLFEKLNDHAYNDQLLHIPNRLAFMRAVGNALASQRLTETVAIIDIDYFSQINHALGHRYGDALLKAVTQRLIDSVPEGSMVARLAADTFGILGPDALTTPSHLLPLFQNSFNIEGTEQIASVTIGLARLSDVDGNGSEAVKSANIALSLAKIHARGESCYFTRDMEFETRARMRLLRELRNAFDRERLFVVYQPLLCLNTHEILGVEALLRWRTDEGNFVSPEQFIPLAESSGLIISLGQWVMRTACHDLKRLISEGFNNLRMSVNVSVMQFRHPGFIDMIDAVLLESQIEPQRLELEITESVAMVDAQLIQGTIKQLKERGLTIAIDDFGTGFSSLSYLERFNVDRLKIDRSFVDQMTLSDNSLRIVESIIQLGLSLDLHVVAEGVEHKAQADALRQLGCKFAQGYLFAHPMAFRQLRAFLSNPPSAFNEALPPAPLGE